MTSQKKPAYFFIAILVTLVMALQGCTFPPLLPTRPPAATAENPTKTKTAEGWTKVGLPFHPDAAHGDWYMTQCFGAYYDAMGGGHAGEDWVCQNSRETACVYPIAPGRIVWYGRVNSKNPDNGYYVVMEHTGKFKIPASSGPHLLASSEPAHDSNHGYKGIGYKIISYTELFSGGPLQDYPFLSPDQTSAVGSDAADGAYRYGGRTAEKVYSVYMHLAGNPEYGEPGSKDIPVDSVDKPLGTLAPSAGKHTAHLHFEIRDESVADLPGNAGFASVINGNGSGYFPDSQKMVDTGYREPGAFLQANLGAPVAAVSEELNLGGRTLSGIYQYADSSQQVRFTMESITQENERISGRISEEQSGFGPSDPIIYASFEGTFDGSQLLFTKVYDFDDYEIRYAGTVNPDMNIIVGTWTITDETGVTTGTFSIDLSTAQ